MEEKELFKSNDEFIITQVCQILKENNIPYIRKDEGAGSYINLAYGQNSISEKSIIVNSNDYKKANKLIEVFTKEDEKHDIPDELKGIEDEVEDEKYNRPKKALRIMIGIFFGVFILLMIISIIMAVK